MKINNYVVAKTLDEAYHLCLEHADNQVIGGGAWMKLSAKKSIQTLIDLKALKCDQIIEEEGQFIIGAGVSLGSLEKHEFIQNYYDGVLYQAITGIMGVGVRNIATIGGSIMGRFSFSDLYAVLIALDCELEFYHQKRVSLRAFLQEKRPKKDILVNVILPKKKLRGYYKKVKRTALDFAILNVCVLKSNTFEIAVGARPGIAKRAVKTMAYLDQQIGGIDETVLDKATEILLEEISFSDNNRASKAYRMDLAKVYVKRGIKEVIS